ncbi:cytochrome P450 [Variovorax paradoxus]|nr:cytochrome P450 [Variovorax paradoxus]
MARAPFSTIAWLIWLLFKNPSALEQCRNEVRRAIAELSSMTPDTIASLNYLEACATEAMRLKPAAPTILNEARSAMSGSRPVLLSGSSPA